MKTISNYNFMWIILAIILIVSGCKTEKHFTISTTVYPDGSCLRTLKAKFKEKPDYRDYPIKIDSTWEIENIYDTIGENQDTFLLYSKRFVSVKALNHEFSDTLNYFSIVKREVKLRKKFQWFYTKLEFNETYNNLFEGEPLSNYVQEKDMWVIRDEKNDSVEASFGSDSNGFKKYVDSISSQHLNWITKTELKNMYDVLIEEISDDSTLAGYKNKIVEMQDTIFDMFIDKNLEDLVYYADSVSQANGKISALLTDSTNNLAYLQKRLDFFQDIWLSYIIQYELVLPGILTSTNADSVRNQVLYFNVKTDRFFTSDYNMFGVTKIKNSWTYYVSGIVAFLALVALIAGMVRKRVMKKS